MSDEMTYCENCEEYKETIDGICSDCDSHISGEHLIEEEERTSPKIYHLAELKTGGRTVTNVSTSLGKLAFMISTRLERFNPRVIYEITDQYGEVIYSISYTSSRSTKRGRVVLDTRLHLTLKHNGEELRGSDAYSYLRELYIVKE